MNNMVKINKIGMYGWIMYVFPLPKTWAMITIVEPTLLLFLTKFINLQAKTSQRV